MRGVDSQQSISHVWHVGVPVRLGLGLPSGVKPLGDGLPLRGVVGVLYADRPTDIARFRFRWPARHSC